MNQAELDSWCRSIFEIEALAGVDDSLNGVQVSRSSPAAPLETVAFAVDACAESIRRAAAAGAQALFVHHGLFWGKSQRVEGALRERLALLFRHDMALFACHLPLDKHPELGNNAVLARLLGMSGLEGFGEHRGHMLGFAGRIDPAISLDEAVRRVLPDGSPPRTLIPGRTERIARAAVVSGGAAFEALQAIGKGVDLYVTGESSHSVYHHVVEGGIAFLAAGHYATETWGVKAVAERLACDASVRTLFIDLPTGL